MIFSFITTKNSSTIIALIATAFYAVIPEMLHRTVAGVPELESIGMMFFWLAFYFYAGAWQTPNKKRIVIFSVLSGLFTGLMILTWGGFRYIFMTIALTSFLLFFFNKDKKKNLLIYLLWFLPSIIFAIISLGRSALFDIPNAGFASLIFLVLLIDFGIFRTKLKEKFKKFGKVPESIVSVVVSFVVVLLLLLIFNPGFISSIFNKAVEGLLYPFGRGRVGLTVAENRAPYLSTVLASFTPLFFWPFLIGVFLLFFEAVKHFDKKTKFKLNIVFILLLIGLIFTRFSPSSTFNGDNFISRFFYFGFLALFAVTMVYFYIKNQNSFQKINFSYIFLLSFFFFMMISMRGAIRLFFILSPAIILGASFLPVRFSEYALNSKDQLKKILLFSMVLLLAIMLLITVVKYSKATSNSARFTVPSSYHQQWQKAMAWTRENTPENSIFIHWWDYGYWVQTLGERPTVTDGGHPTIYWDHLIGRYLLTAENEETALQLLKAHNVSYLLIDSTDIGKYGAYASIGSDTTGRDRLGSIGTFVLDERQTQETRNETLTVYVGGFGLDEDLVWQGQLLPAGRAVIAGFVLSLQNNNIRDVNAVIIYNNQQFRIPVKNMYIDGLVTLSEGEGLDGVLYLIPSLSQQRVVPAGAALYLSEKVSKTTFAELYLLGQGENFELVHNEPSFLVQQLRQQNIPVGDFVFAGSVQGPIKIWKVNYPSNIKFHEEYLKKRGDWADLDHLGT